MLDVNSEFLLNFYRDFYEPIKLRTRSPRTRVLYVTSIRSLQRFLGREPKLSDLNDVTISRYLSSLRQRGLAAHTANKEWANLGAIWRWATRQQLPDGSPVLRGWPNIENEKLPHNDPNAWREQDLAKLFAFLRDAPGSIGDIPASGWWYSLHSAMWDSLERISALMQARWDWLDLDGGWMSVPAEARKGGRMGRTYPLHAQTIEALRGIQHPARELVWPWPYSYTLLWRKYGQLLKKAGLPNGHKYKFHCIRRSGATHAEVAGGNATALLGHTARKTTLAYLDPKILKPKAPTDYLFRPDDRTPDRRQA